MSADPILGLRDRCVIEAKLSLLGLHKRLKPEEAL